VPRRPGLTRRGPAFGRDPVKVWTMIGAILGMIFGLVAGAIGAGMNQLFGGVPEILSPGPMALIGGMIGGLGVLVWTSLLWPVLLALFASERFQREYGTPRSAASSAERNREAEAPKERIRL
jgi:hypothetical protein